MLGSVHIPSQFVSRYSLLGAFAVEIGDAFAAAGWRVNPPIGERGPHLFLLLNSPARLEQVFEWMRAVSGGEHTAIVQYFVDHPLGLHAPHLDRFAVMPNYRLLMPCKDDAHMLRLRWPALRHMHCGHGVAPSALCDIASLGDGHVTPAGERGGRDLPLLVAGSIHSEAELDSLRAALPAPLRPVCDGIVELQLAAPSLTFTQAFDLALPAGMISPDHWQFLAAVWRCTTAELNRRRRVGLVRAVQGVPTIVAGPPAWKEECIGTLNYVGEVAYADLSALMRRARVCLAWGPTQFAHSYSERPLLSMAAGCATLTDERLSSRADFVDSDGPCAAFYDSSRPDTLRELVESLLLHPERSARMSMRGRVLIESAHLWSHRVPTMIAAARDALAAA